MDDFKRIDTVPVMVAKIDVGHSGAQRRTRSISRRQLARLADERGRAGGETLHGR
jgi:hypothetical protein